MSISKVSGVSRNSNRCFALLFTFTLAGAPLACAPTAPLTKTTTTATATAANAPTVTLTLSLPPTFSSTSGVLTFVPFTAAEIAAKAHEDPHQVFVWMERLRRATDLDSDPGTVTLRVPASAEPSFVQVRFDIGADGLEALLDARATVAMALVPLAPATDVVSATLVAPAPQPPREPCSGPRLEKIVLVADELRRSGDDGAHTLCVYLPAHYGDEPERRYPVAFALPGFSGFAVWNDGFGARGLFDSIGAAVGVEAIVVGVETRTAEGTSYLASSARFGDWDSYFIKRVVPEIDRRYRTTQRRGVYGHSTGGWNAVSIALRHPEVFAAVAASSPDPLDLDLWLFDESGALAPRWRAWALAEQALAGRGQFTSWAASWSPRQDGADELVDKDGAVRPAVLERWRAASPAAFIRTPTGLAAARRLSGHIFLTAGTADMFDLFRPTERFQQLLGAQGVDARWARTEFDHFGSSERFSPLVRFLLEQLAMPTPESPPR